MRYFAYAFCRLPDIIQARRLSEEVRFHKISGQVCRILPFDKELFKKAEPGANLFVKGLNPSWTHKDLYTLFSEYGEVVSARVSLCEDFSCRGYGFVLFERSSDAQKAIKDLKQEESKCQERLTIKVYQTRSERN